MRVAILGASGAIGQRLLPYLRSNGHDVVALTHMRTLEATLIGGGRSRPVDILELASLVGALDGCDAVINLATSIPNGHGRGNWRENDRIRIEGTENLLKAIRRQTKPCRLIQQSIAMLHQCRGLADEDCELTGSGILTSAVLMEAMVQDSGADWVLIRGGALYGEGTARDRSFFSRIRAGELAAPEESDRWISFIHIDDLARAFLHALNLPGHCAFIAADNAPTTYARMFRALAPQALPSTGVPMLQPLPSFRVSNQRLRATGWHPVRPSVLDPMDKDDHVLSLEWYLAPGE